MCALNVVKPVTAGGAACVFIVGGVWGQLEPNMGSNYTLNKKFLIQVHKIFFNQENINISYKKVFDYTF